MSLTGGAPNSRRYSRLNCEGTFANIAGLPDKLVEALARNRACAIRRDVTRLAATTCCSRHPGSAWRDRMKPAGKSSPWKYQSSVRRPLLKVLSIGGEKSGSGL